MGHGRWLMAKRRKAKKGMPVRLGERATMELRAQCGGVITEVIDRDLRGNPYMIRDRVRIECALDYYFWDGRLTQGEYEAGLKFRRAYQRAVLGLKVEDPASSGAYDPEMAMLIVPISEEILRDAYGELSTAQKKIIIDVCGHNKYAGTTDRVETLHRGLEKLATLWRL